MPVIAVVNRKGGSGKSTLATHLASHYANAGVPVMLGDVDRQQSTQTWLRARALRDLPSSAPIVGWAVDPKRVLRPPAGVSHVVLDTPGGLRGFDLARVAAFADVMVMPVCNSIFDRESAGECFAELMALPRPVMRGNPSVVRPPADGATRVGDDLVARMASNDVDRDLDDDVGALALAVIERPRAAAQVAPAASPARAASATPAPKPAAAKPRTAAAPARGFRFAALFGWLAPRFLHR
jgi:hypothetical protein